MTNTRGQQRRARKEEQYGADEPEGRDDDEDGEAKAGAAARARRDSVDTGARAVDAAHSMRRGLDERELGTAFADAADGSDRAESGAADGAARIRAGEDRCAAPGDDVSHTDVLDALERLRWRALRECPGRTILVKACRRASTHPPTHPLSLPHSLTHSLAPSLTHSLTHPVRLHVQNELGEDAWAFDAFL